MRWERETPALQSPTAEVSVGFSPNESLFTIFFHIQDYCFLQQMLQSLAHQLSCRYHGLLLQTGRTVSLTTLSTSQTPVEQSVSLTPQMVALATLLISHAVMLRLRSVDGVREERERGAQPMNSMQVCVCTLPKVCAVLSEQTWSYLL